MLVEDSSSDAELTKEALDADSFECIAHLEDGEEAIEFLQRKGKYTAAIPPDMVLLDLNLPCMNGLEVLREMRADPDLALIPVIVLTTSEDDDDIRAAYRMHANCFVSKPVSMPKFTEAMKALESFWLGYVAFPPPA